MYVIEKRAFKGYHWSRVWESEDGHDTADYLKTTTLNATNGDEYRMRFVVTRATLTPNDKDTR